MTRSPVALAGIYTLSVGLACYGWFVPAKMPPDYDAIFSISIPIAVLWVCLVVGAVAYFGRRAAWTLLGAPLALYWPLWLAFSGLPECYYTGNCS